MLLFKHYEDTTYSFKNNHLRFKKTQHLYVFPAFYAFMSTKINLGKVDRKYPSFSARSAAYRWLKSHPEDSLVDVFLIDRHDKVRLFTFRRSNGVQRVCSHYKGCGHSWPYKGESLYYINCPRCRKNINITKLVP